MNRIYEWFRLLLTVFLLNKAGPSFALVDWIKPGSDRWGLYTNHSPDYDFANPDSDWLFTLTLDFVF